MRDYRIDFESFGKKIWLNAGSEGPLPISAAAALTEAVRWKSLPYELNNERFVTVPKKLKLGIGKLLQVPARDVILGNSASYGLHLLANGIPWQRHDEIVLMQNDFPTNILPWLALGRVGVRVQQIKAAQIVLTPGELEKNISPRTKLLCLSHVHTFSGHMLDIEGFARVCKKNNILFVLNISQSAGTMPLDFSSMKVDAIIGAGYKWLCGPYGTGFAWIKPDLRDQLDLNLSYWIPSLSDSELQSEEALQIKELKNARKFDIFGTANFFNFVPFEASLAYLQHIGFKTIFKHNQALIDQFIDGLPSMFQLISPPKGPNRSNLIFITHRDSKKNRAAYRALIGEGIYPGFWKGNIRICPHLYNTVEEIRRLLNNLKTV